MHGEEEWTVHTCLLGVDTADAEHDSKLRVPVLLKGLRTIMSRGVRVRRYQEDVKRVLRGCKEGVKRVLRGVKSPTTCQAGLLIQTAACRNKA